MKKQILSIVLILIGFNAFLIGQSKNGQKFKPGRQDFMAGVGLVSTQVVSGKSKMLPLHLAWEYRCTKAMSVGLMAGRMEAVTRYPELEGDWENKTWSISARLMGHCSRLKKWDVYGGVALVFLHERTIPGTEFEARDMIKAGIKGKDNKLIYSALVGAKRCIGKRFTAFAEAGFNVSLLSVGMGYLIRN